MSDKTDKINEDEKELGKVSEEEIETVKKAELDQHAVSRQQFQLFFLRHGGQLVFQCHRLIKQTALFMPAFQLCRALRRTCRCRPAISAPFCRWCILGSIQIAYNHSFRFYLLNSLNTYLPLYSCTVQLLKRYFFTRSTSYRSV